MTKENAAPTLTRERLQQFFEERKRVVGISPIGEEAGLSRGYINRVLRGEHKLTQKTVDKLLPVLYKYGYEAVIDDSLEVTLTIEKLKAFLDARKKSLSMSPLGEEAGLAADYLNKIYRGERGLSQKTIEKLMPILQKYGYKG